MFRRADISCGRRFVFDFLLRAIVDMTQNMGTLDRLLRTAAAIAVGVLYATGTIGGTIAAVLGVVAAAFLLTSSVGTCPLYMPLGLSTCKATAEQ